jgi:hypothetical protein
VTQLAEPLPSVAKSPTGLAGPRGWGRFTAVVLRFTFTYWLLFSLQVTLGFPAQVATTAFSVARGGAAGGAEQPEWLTRTVEYVSYPELYFQRGLNWFTPRVAEGLLGVEVEPPTDFTGSGDRLYDYCICFAFLVAALAVTVLWTAAGELWRGLRTHRPPNYDRLHTLLRAVVRFQLMYSMIVYGAAKLWCSQFPPILDTQLEVKYGDSSPMGLLWRFMQFSQPYTIITGAVEFTCGLLLISRRTTLLGALCAAGAALQVWLLNMCYDVPVKLLSGHLLLMALTLIVPDVPRLFRWFVLGRAVAPRPLVPLFGGWRWFNLAAVVAYASVCVAFAGLSLLQAYQEARTRGILAPTNALSGRWVGEEFLRDGKRVPFPKQPENPPPRQVKPGKWQGGPGMPAVVRCAVGPMYVTLMFEDGSGIGYRNTSKDHSELVLVGKDGHEAGRLAVSFPEPDTLVLEGPMEEQKVRMTLRRIVPPPKKEGYLLRSRGFHWIQETPFNR